MDMHVPDLTVYRLDEAINILKKKGISYTLKKTLPPFSSCSVRAAREKKIQLRVLKQIITGPHTVELVIAEEDN